MTPSGTVAISLIVLLIFILTALVFFWIGEGIGEQAAKEKMPKQPETPEEEYMTPCEEDGHHIIAMDKDSEAASLPVSVRHYCTKCGITLFDLQEERKRLVR